MTLVFVPVDGDGLRRWAETGNLDPALAFSPGGAFRDAFGLTEADGEEAEYTCLHVAALAGLLTRGTRLVAVASVDVVGAGDEMGRVHPGPLSWSQVTSLFADGSPELASRAAVGFGPGDLEAAWDDPRIETLLASGDLLWHGRDEWGTLVGSQRKG